MLHFDDWKTFEEWKEKEEESCNAHFVQSTGIKKSSTIAGGLLAMYLIIVWHAIHC